MRIGIDFDNTLAGYDHLFLDVAREWELVPDAFAGGKREIRDEVRRLDDGERRWMRLQAEIYGARMGEAKLLDGARAFLQSCRRSGVVLSVISHKTRYAAADPGGLDLHEASLTWMKGQGFFDTEEIALSPGQIFFEPTREAKCRRIGTVGCSHFIDDLEEVFQDPAFPEGVDRLLLDLSKANPRGPFTVYQNWQAIHDTVFAPV